MQIESSVCVMGVSMGVGDGLNEQRPSHKVYL